MKGGIEMPFLKRITLDWSAIDPREKEQYPYNIPAIRRLRTYDFDSNVTFFIGDNGSGKSTLLEAIGSACGFSIVGGRDLVIQKEKDDHSLSKRIKLAWLPKVSSGFYFRAETFDTYTTYLDELAKDPYIGSSAYGPYGGKSLNELSHGQAFLNFFANRLG